MLGFLNLISRHSGESRKPYGSDTSTIFKNHVKQTTRWIPAFAGMTKRDNSKSPSGNAVVLILIAVALFGALSYTFMRGSKSGTGNLTSNQAKLAAQEIVDYAQTITRAVDKVRQKGCSETQISFENPKVAGYTYATEDMCKIFNSSGGGANHVTPNPAWLDSTVSSTENPGEYVFSGGSTISFVGPSNNAPAGKDIIIFLKPLREEICIAINNLVNTPNNNSLPYNEHGGFNMDVFVGTFQAAASGIDDDHGVTGSALDGLSTGCVYRASTGNGGPGYTFYHAILER